MPKPGKLTIAEKLASGAMLDFRLEFCPWLGISHVTGYKLVEEGRAKITKIGRKSMVAAPDAIACREALRNASNLEASAA
jgi:hypothetical protein